MAKRKKITEFFSSTSRPTTSSDISSDPDSGPPLQTKKGKHRESGFDPAWLNEFPWLLLKMMREKMVHQCFVVSVISIIK